MMTSRNSTIAQKRDLHVGGVGSIASAGLATMIEPVSDASEAWLHKARNVGRATDDYVRENRWAAVGVIAVLGLAAGYLLSRRS